MAAHDESGLFPLRAEDRALGLRLAEYAAAAYDPLHYGLSRADIDRVSPFVSHRAQGFVVAHPDELIVAFGGSDDAEDWLISLVFAQVEGYGGRAHKGFADALDSLWTPLLAALYDADFDDRPVTLTGHSLGGALATLAGWRFGAELDRPCQVVTYGAPAILNPKAAGEYGPGLLRFVNDGDPVPSLRWPRLDHPYVHAGREIYLLRHGAIASGRYSRGLSARIERQLAYLDLDGPEPRRSEGWYADHRIGEHVRRLDGAARVTTPASIR